MKKMLLGLTGAFTVAVVCAQSAPTPAPTAPVPPARGPSLSLALEAVEVAIAACSKKGFSIGASVVDSAGIPKAVLAADGARARGVQSSTNKAVTAIKFGEATSALNERQKANPDLAAKLAADPNLNARPGAVLLKAGEAVIGAIGVGGASPSEVDEECAKEGLAAVQARLR